MQTEKFMFKLNDNSEVAVNRWLPENEENIKAVIVLSHGMQEHSLRYDRIGSICAEKGYVFNAHDVRGHGKTAQNAEKNGTGSFGILAEKNGFDTVTDDLAEIIEEAKKDFPGKKIILIGHSFGSFVAENYIENSDPKIDGCILLGSSGKNIIQPFGIFATAVAALFRGKKYRSRTIQNLAFSGYNKRFKNENDDISWLSASKANRDMYRNDSWCGGISSISFFNDLAKGLCKIYKTKNLLKISKELPLLAMCGSDDPVGNYGKSVNKVIELLKENGHKKADFKVYMGDRHELLNEDDSENIIQDIFDWIESIN